MDVSKSLKLSVLRPLSSIPCTAKLRCDFEQRSMQKCATKEIRLNSWTMSLDVLKTFLNLVLLKREHKA